MARRHQIAARLTRWAGRAFRIALLPYWMLIIGALYLRVLIHREPERANKGNRRE